MANMSMLGAASAHMPGRRATAHPRAFLSGAAGKRGIFLFATQM